MLAAAQKLVDVVKTSALTTGSWSVKALAADPNVQAAIVPVLEAAAASSALNWAAVDTTALLAKVGSSGLHPALRSATISVALLCSRRRVSDWALGVPFACRSGHDGGPAIWTCVGFPPQGSPWGILLLEFTTGCCEARCVSLGMEVKASSASCAVQAAAVSSFVAAAPDAAAALPALPNFSALFAGRKLLGRQLLQVILNPGDFLGLTTDQSKGSTPSVADANRLNAQLGLQVCTLAGHAYKL